MILFSSIILSALSLVVRYHRARGVERQQLKWVALAAVLLVGLIVADQLRLDRLLGGTLWNLLAVATQAGLYVAVGIAILKHRLYDIDIIINRTLVYAVLTALLAAGYVATIMAFQGIGSLVYQLPFRALIGQESALATVAATLAMAALFSPLRRRIQSFIDRRFYRSKYDAIKTLEDFSVKLKDETDLEALSEDLVGVVIDTMQPAHVSLWLRPDTVQRGEQRG
jgi:hypothetical protein